MISPIQWQITTSKDFQIWRANLESATSRRKYFNGHSIQQMNFRLQNRNSMLHILKGYPLPPYHLPKASTLLTLSATGSLRLLPTIY